MIKFNYNPTEKIITCYLSGQLDTYTCTGISEEMQQKLNEIKIGLGENELPDHKIDFDMKEVTFISSSFIRICLVTFKSLKQGNFTISNCDPFMKKTFKIAGLDDLLKVS
jgi:anti-anti-sigma factor